MVDLRERLVGCVAGGAIGDAMGSAYEGHMGPVSERAVAEWRTSDDTQLTLATCEALDGHGASPEAIASRFLAWYRARRLSGLGASTLKALRDLEAGAHWALAGRKGEMAAGNGAAMRAAPLAFCLDASRAEDRALLRDVCWITHHNDEAYAGALAIVRAIQCVLSGVWSPGTNLPSLVAETLPDTRVRDALLALEELPPEASIADAALHVGCSGYVAESVPLAIFAAQAIGGRGLEDVLWKVIEVGGDTDTIASMTGQIVGAWLGISALPENLLGKVPEAGMIVATARALADRLEVPG